MSHCLINGRSGSWKPRVLCTVVGNILALSVFSLVASPIHMRGQVSQAVEMVLMGATDYLARGVGGEAGERLLLNLYCIDDRPSLIALGMNPCSGSPATLVSVNIKLQRCVQSELALTNSCQ